VNFACPDTDTLYREARALRWHDLFVRGRSFAVFANVSDSAIRHSQFAALRLKDAVVDYFRETTGHRPNVDVEKPDIGLNLYIRKNQAVISLDLSGGPLYKRGYREESVAAPMQETVAAALIRLSGWDGSIPLYDPMCGSGTLLCEALMSRCRIPAGIFRRRFGFEVLPDFDAAAWKAVKADAQGGIREIDSGLIAGSDRDEKAVDAARTNLMGIHHGSRVVVNHTDFNEIESLEGHLILTNPPYGIRLDKGRDMGPFYKELGTFLKRRCQGASAFVYFGDRRYTKSMGLRAAWKRPLAAGGLDGRLVRYDLY